jgi:acyl-CoA hydrolase
VVTQMPIIFDNTEACVEAMLHRIGRRIHLGTPLGLGKANHLVNEFFRRAREDPRLELRISTALTLARPRWKNDIERRFVEPLAERLFGGYPELEYVDPLRSGKLPDNIRVNEFYFQPGSLMGSPLAQQNYVSSNYSHVVRTLMDAGINVVAQLVAKTQEDGATRYSLSCNPDLTLDLVPRMRERERRGERFAMLAEVNRNLPFMYGDAAVGPDFFDAIVDNARLDFPLFGPPSYPIGTTDYMIALHVGALIRDGGTLQLGIGALGDAITFLLKLRHERNELYLDLLTKAGILEHFGAVVERVGGTGPFREGLFAATEMLVAGFLDLYRSGILKRSVYPHPGVQRLLNEHRIGEDVTPAMLETLVDAGIVAARLTAKDFELLKSFGVLKPEVSFEAGHIRVDDESIPADLGDEHAAGAIRRRCLGTRLKGGHVAQSCFFLGPRSFYDALGRMDRSEREQICMTGISYVNELYGHEELKRLQRKEARFVNTGLVATLTGAVASDALEDGRVVSGVGGQYNFVAMAHALEDGRSILMIRSTHEDRGRVQSNIRWTYGTITIPRHLRDFVVTEYGIADLRGRTDEQVATALLEIADSRFQRELLEEAKRAGKVSAGYDIPESFRSNRPDRLEKFLAPYRARGLFEEFPFGTDLTREEAVLMKALGALKQRVARKKIPIPRAGELRKLAVVPESARPYLERMGLDAPRTLREKLLRRVIVYALASVDAI